MGALVLTSGAVGATVSIALDIPWPWLIFWEPCFQLAALFLMFIFIPAKWWYKA